MPVILALAADGSASPTVASARAGGEPGTAWLQPKVLVSADGTGTGPTSETVQTSPQRGPVVTSSQDIGPSSPPRRINPRVKTASMRGANARLHRRRQGRMGA
ncbi:hypothetical protein GCM10023235_09960 [Kitasatospora terrestris]|uniref:Secreted protein n=1 Tax=Kitasatospora terrestris TaxID=258051 RepID=A0ABP9DAP4_9ACTN